MLITSRAVKGPWLFLLRSLFPNWRFYDAPGPSPRLFTRRLKAEVWSDWRMMMPRFRRGPFSLFHNPAVNLALLEQTLIDHLAADIADCADGADVKAFVSYRMVERLAREKIKAAGEDATRFQFCVCLERHGAPPDFEGDTILLSPSLDC